MSTGIYVVNARKLIDVQLPLIVIHRDSCWFIMTPDRHLLTKPRIIIHVLVALTMTEIW
ncbi:unnamed protein product [Penicillium camemberti]|uniref:Str. FM013 n=1 Tax=Penicillium camemberti (strain FM 013) TaxID=1429867 RepID=A0A0G4NXG9_PENC3|nr:unnamed protein product [Penicillium camemberti]